MTTEELSRFARLQLVATAVIALPIHAATIFSDDFDDNVINVSQWSFYTPEVANADEEMQVVTTHADQPGTLSSAAFPIASDGLITISRRAYFEFVPVPVFRFGRVILYEYFTGAMRFNITGLPEFGVDYNAYDDDNALSQPSHGIFISRNGHRATDRNYQDDVSLGTDGVWYEWFDETITYSPASGALDYFINGVSQLAFNVGAVTATGTVTMAIRFEVNGNGWVSDWGTDHRQYLDDLVVSQEPPASLSLQSSAASDPDRPGYVTVDYGLSITNAASATVTPAFSSDGGATWFPPNAGTLSGDRGPGVTSGSHSITWSAGSQMPTTTFNQNFRARLTAMAGGMTVTSTSPVFTLDLQGIQGGLTIAGKVLDGRTRQPVGDVIIRLSGQSATSSANGGYILTGVALNGGNTLTAEIAGFAMHEQIVSVPAGATRVTVPDISLQALTPENINKPIITKVDSRLRGIFLSGATMNNDFTASVNWNGFTPGYVSFYVHDVLVADTYGTGSQYKCTIDMGGASFRPSFNLFANEVRVFAVGGDGTRSEPFILHPVIVPIPDAIKLLTAQGYSPATFLTGHLGLDYDFPSPPLAANLNLPVVGRFGFEVSGNGSFDYTVTDGDWEVAVGVGAEGKQGKRGRRPIIPALTRHPKLKLYIGNRQVSGKLEVGGRGTATFDRGITFDELFGHAEIEAKLELGRVGLLDAIPGLSSVAGAIPSLGAATKTISFIIFVIPGVEGEVVCGMHPKVAFESMELNGRVGLEASYEPKLGPVEMRLYVGGEPSVTFQIPGDLLKDVRFKAYAGAEFQWKLFKLGPVEYVFVDVTYPSQPSALCTPVASRGPDFTALPGAYNDSVRTVSRTSLTRGGEQFVALDSSARRMAANVSGFTSLDEFRLMGQTPSRGSIPGGMGLQLTPSAPVKTLALAQTSMQIISNAFPSSEPALAGASSNLMLLYVSDGGYSNDLQFTDIRWTMFDGWNWRVPTSIVADTRAEFSPQVKFDGNADAIAVWERVSDPNFTNASIPAMAAQLEIVWSKWDHVSGQWSEPSALTTNGHLDHTPLLAGPLTNGDLLVAWTRNMTNLLMGTGTSGAAENDSVLWSRWRVSDNSWSEPQVLASNIANKLSESLAAASNLAVYVWTSDADGVLTNDDDQEVYSVSWTDSHWSTPIQRTTNTVVDRNVRTAISTAGAVQTVWQQSSSLVSSVDFAMPSVTVRADSSTAGFSDYVMACGPQGATVLLWQEMTEYGSDAHYTVCDPISHTWSKDERLFMDSSLERSFSPVWDNVGNLTVAYNTVVVTKTNRVVLLEDGSSVVVSNVPQTGVVNLGILKRALVTDAAILPGDFLVAGANWMPGDVLTLSAALRNVGDVAIGDPCVAFYNGDPSAGGALITNIVWPGWLRGAETGAMVSATWVIPEPATNLTVYAVVNPNHGFAEFTENNNTQFVGIGGSDLAVALISSAAETSGAIRVVAQVQNLGAPGATNTTLAIRRRGQSGSPLATVDVPFLQPGRLAQVALDLPDGTQPEGEAFYTLTADDAQAVFDVETNNNSADFVVNLWLDSDGDGIPNWWETANRLDANTPDDAIGDKDHDGMSNYEEWRAGTDPGNPSSFLKVQALAPLGTNQPTGGFRLSWGSESNKFYTVSRASSLVDGVGFSPISQHILATPRTNICEDTSVSTNAGPLFYRIDVE